MSEWHEIGQSGNYRRTVTAYTPPGVVEVIGGGTTSFVGLLNDGKVLKYPIVQGESVKEFEVEAAIYEALGKHPHIIGYLGQTRFGIKLERGSRLTEHLGDGTDLSLKLQWVQQSAEGLRYLHSRGVLHCDLHPDNLLLDEKKNIKICDFQGKMEKFDGTALERVRYCLPRPEYIPSVQSDIFALGSTIFRIMTGCDPYQDVPEDEITAKYERLEFPATNFICGTQVRRCWQQKYSCVDEVISELASTRLDGT
ncbi:hypothetical protein M433DRAFT_160030 [Acidomyces richmondensis BFW]|nr:hypothetical protein M433DRAFT_160030 [Acidomyces richmondensis BFW]